MNDPQPPPGLIDRLNRIALAHPVQSVPSLEKQRQILRRKLHRLRVEATTVYRQIERLDRMIDGGGDR